LEETYGNQVFAALKGLAEFETEHQGFDSLMLQECFWKNIHKKTSPLSEK